MVQAAKKLTQAIDSEKVRDIERSVESGANFLPRMMTEFTDLCSHSTQTAMECFDAASSATQEISEETVKSCNRALAECTDISKAVFACRTINDVMELQNRLVNLAMQQGFAENGKLLTKSFDSCTAMLKPLQDYVANTSNRLMKSEK